MAYLTPADPVRLGRSRIRVGSVELDALSELGVVETVREAWARGQGGHIVTVNVDIARAAAGCPSLTALVARAPLVVADGMPLVWAAAVAGTRLPGRVAGSSLVFSLSEAAALDGQSVFFLGGPDGVPGRAAEAMRTRFANLRVAGSYSPPFGFDQTEGGTRTAVAAVMAADPRLVFVGLGFPKQERLIENLRQALPDSWFLGCGAGIPMAAGAVPRASAFTQKLGLEWLHRLALEPRRLAGRYLRDDMPFALELLARSALRRIIRRWP
jgi:N-acetylglucosaminyldiphosphoundecaprenol N-acetyl-beta-D-mannosaminyltransferase